MFRTVFVSFLAGMFIGVFASLKFIKKEVPVEVIKDRIVEVVRTEKSPNGQTVITKTITKDIEKPVIIPQKKNYAIGAFYNLNKDYGVILERRIMADFWLGVGLSQKQELLVNIKYEF
jgi:MFS superfamily sulfate permease-like transporter